jgi:hypothetical protein
MAYIGPGCGEREQKRRTRRRFDLECHGLPEVLFREDRFLAVAAGQSEP